MILTFGKYKGKEVKDCPSQYLAWLMKPTIQDKKTKELIMYPVPKEIMEEARNLFDKRLKEENYKKWRLNGYIGDKLEYIIERLGDLEYSFSGGDYHSIDNLTIHNSLEEALKQLEIEYPIGTRTKEQVWDGHPEGTYRETPDPEDDRILIWEVMPNGHKKVVWHFSGWHWDAEEFPGLGQGSLPGDKESLYNLAMEDY